jgi:Nitroreductase
MSFLDLAKKRYTVRAYTKQAIEKAKLDIILEAGQVAPTGANMQPQRLIVVQSEAGLNKLGKATNIYNAPLAIIVCSDKSQTWTRPFDGKKLTDIDASIVTDHMMLSATDLGLGSVWVCYFKPDIIKTEFNLPDNLEPINILAIGYPDLESEPSQTPCRHSSARKDLSATVSFETFTSFYDTANKYL